MKIPTSRDIYIEADGKRVAVVQSYSAKTVRESKSIEAFGSSVPVATVGGRQVHTIELTKVVPVYESAESKVDFYGLSNFTLMIVKPDCRIVYAGCEWSDIAESGSLNAPCIEKVHVLAAKRMVLT